jgi:hypothetical protein
MGMGMKNIMRLGWTGTKISAINKAINENSRFTKANIVRSKGKIYFGMYTFFRSGAFETTAYIAELVDSEKKLKINEPVR